MDVTVVHLQLIHLIALYLDFIVIVPDSNISLKAVHQWVLWLLFFFSSKHKQPTVCKEFFCEVSLLLVETPQSSIVLILFMYRRPTLCTLHIAVDFLKSLKIAVV